MDGPDQTTAGLEQKTINTHIISVTTPQASPASGGVLAHCRRSAGRRSQVYSGRSASLPIFDDESVDCRKSGDFSASTVHIDDVTWSFSSCSQPPFFQRNIQGFVLARMPRAAKERGTRGCWFDLVECIVHCATKPGLIRQLMF